MRWRLGLIIALAPSVGCWTLIYEESIVGVGLDAGSATADAGDAHHDDAGARLQGDTYIAGMEKASTAGHFKVALISSDPIPQDLTVYSWVVEVRDADGTALEGVSVVATPTMPEHGHGTFPATVAGQANGETGQFVLSGMDLFMAGTWQIELQLVKGETEDRAFFYFTLDT